MIARLYIPSNHLPVAAAIFLMAGIYFMLQDTGTLRRLARGKYSLEALAEVEAKQALRDAEAEHDLSQVQDKFCICCGETCGPQFHACPRCGKPL